MPPLNFITPAAPAAAPRESFAPHHQLSPALGHPSFESLVQHALDPHPQPAPSLNPSSPSKPAKKFGAPTHADDSRFPRAAKKSSRAIKAAAQAVDSPTDDDDESQAPSESSDKAPSVQPVASSTLIPVVPLVASIVPKVSPENPASNSANHVNQAIAPLPEITPPPAANPALTALDADRSGDTSNGLAGELQLKDSSASNASPDQNAATAQKDSSAKASDAASVPAPSHLHHPIHDSFERSSKPAIPDLPPASDSLGTSGAKLEEQMRKAVKTVKSADAQQDLPSESAAPSRVDSPSLARPTADSTTFPNRIEVTAVTTSTFTGPDSPTETTQFTVTASAPTDIQARTLERTQDVVALHAFRLRDTNMESLQVTLRPGDGIQLSLNLQKQAGAIQAQATLQHGNFEHLSAHWATLQRHLQSHGVQLGPLERNLDSFAGNSNHPKQFDRRPSDNDVVPFGRTAELALAGSMTEPLGKPARHASAHRGWESWA